MTKEELAQQLNGREYREEITKAEEQLAKENDLVVLFGYSDDNAEFRGAIREEVGCYDGGKLLVSKLGAAGLSGAHDCDCDFCGYADHVKHSATIEALWAKEEGYSWTYKTAIPHATFEIVEGQDKYCRGIVFSIHDLP